MTNTDLDTADNGVNPNRALVGQASVLRPLANRGYDDYTGRGNLPPEGGFDIGQSLIENWRIFNKRRGLIATIFLSSVGLGLLHVLIATPYYTSTVRLQIDRNESRPLERGNVAPSENNIDLEFMKTQFELLQSRTLAERVASVLNLVNDKDFLRASENPVIGSLGRLFASNPQGLEPTVRPATEQQAGAILLRHRGVKPVAGSRLVDISYADPSPERAQKVATAFADGFIASQLDKRFQANSYAKTFLEDQVQQLKLRLQQSEQAQLEFAEKEQIVVVSERASIAETNLSNANTALGTLVSERIKNEELWKQVDTANAINLPQFLSNTAIENLRSKRSTLVTEYQQKLETFKPSYPAMVQINNQIADIDRQLTNEVKAIKASLKGAFEASANQEQEMRNRIEHLRTELLEMQRRSIQYNVLKRETDTNRSLYESLLQRYKEVDIAGNVGSNNVFIIDKPDRPIKPSYPVVGLELLFAALVGLGLGLGSAFVLEKLDDTVTSPEEAERIAGLPMLGVVPKIDSAAQLAEEIADPRSALSESYRSLCTALQFSTETGLPKTLLVTSAGPSEGKSSTVVSIANYFAGLGLKVLVVDADLRKPSLHKKLARDNSVGLSNYLTGALTPPEVIQKTAHPNLALLSSGPLPPNAADLLSNARFMSLLSVGLDVFDLIIVDGPPVMGLADAPILSSVCQATVFIISAGEARIGNIRGALRRLQLARGPVIGAVLTKYNPRIAGYGYSYSYHNYGYGYSYGGSDPRVEAPGTQAQQPAITDAGKPAA